MERHRNQRIPSVIKLNEEMNNTLLSTFLKWQLGEKYVYPYKYLYP